MVAHTRIGSNKFRLLLTTNRCSLTIRDESFKNIFKALEHLIDKNMLDIILVANEKKIFPTFHRLQGKVIISFFSLTVEIPFSFLTMATFTDFHFVGYNLIYDWISWNDISWLCALFTLISRGDLIL